MNRIYTAQEIKEIYGIERKSTSSNFHLVNPIKLLLTGGNEGKETLEVTISPILTGFNSVKYEVSQTMRN